MVQVLYKSETIKQVYSQAKIYAIFKVLIYAIVFTVVNYNNYNNF